MSETEKVAVVLPPRTVEDFACRLLQSAGAAPDKARITAQCLLAANLRGVDSHGMQLLPFYLDQMECGNIALAAEGRVLNESGACILYDAERGLGAVVADICCRHANRLAREHGLGIVVVRNSNHFGACAFWGQKISAEGNIGIVMCNASSIVPPWQAREPRLGTNPICMSVPGDQDRAWLLDMATTTVAAGKIFKAYINKLPSIPSGWAMDKDGRPTTDPVEAYHGLIMPLGGYKGYGLAMMAEILCAVLSGGPMSTGVGGIRLKDRPMGTSQMFLAIDVKRFLPEADFLARMDWLVAAMKSAAPAADYDEVLVAGEPEIRFERERREKGIPILDGVWQRLCEKAEKLGVEAPAESPNS